MTSDDTKDDTIDAATDALPDDEYFRSFDLDDYFEKRRRTDHATNAALHSTLRALAESDASRVANVNLMASHGPGEKDHAATYEVVVDIENGGAGTAATGGTIVSKLVDYGDVVITDAESSSIVPESDAYDGDGDYPVDRLTVRLRPVETRVEPVEVPYRFVPDEVKGVSEQTVAAVLGDAEARLNEEFRSVSPVRVFRDVVEDYGDVLPEPDVDGADDRLRSLDARLEDFPSGWRDQKVGPAYLEDGYDDVVRYAKKVLRHAIEEEGSNGRTYEAARVLATLLYMVDPEADEDEPDGYPYLDDLLDRVDHDFGWEESPDGCVEYVTFPDLDTPCVTYECPTTATKARRYQFPSGYVVDVPVCDLHADDFDRSLLSHPLQDEDAYHAIDFEGNTVEVPHFEDEGDVVAFARAYLDAYDVDHPVEPSGYAKTDDNGVPYEDATGEEFEPYSVRREKRPNIDLAIQDRDDASIVAKVEGEKAGEWHKVDTGRGIYNARVDVEVDAYPEAIEAALPDGWSVAATDVFESFDMRRYTIDVYNRAYGRHRDDADDVDRSGTAADGIASGLGLAATAEAIDRRDDGDGVERGDVDLPDEVIGKALYKGTLAYNDEGRLVDNRDAMREGGNE